MSEQSIRFQYQKGIVTGGYSFSANNNIITLSGYVEKLDNARIREAIQYEAKRARSFYVEEVNRLKASGEKVSTFHIKREAMQKAKTEAKSMYADIWNDVEAIYKNPPQTPVAAKDERSTYNSPYCSHDGANLIVALIRADHAITQTPYYESETLTDNRSLIESLAETLTLKEATTIIENQFSGYNVHLCVLSPYRRC